MPMLLNPIPAPKARPKRKRKAFACTVCRRRKLKCDQSMPACNRCIKSGEPDACVYEPYSADALSANSLPAVEEAPPLRMNTPPATPHSIISNNTIQKGRVTSSRNGSQSNKLSNAPPKYPAGTMLIKRREFQTQYYGATNPLSLVMHFPALRAFMAESIHEHDPKMETDLKAIRKNIKAKELAETSSINLSLVQLLPDKEKAKMLATLYFQRLEITYRVLHEPTFWESFDSIWTNNPDLASVTILHLVCILAQVSIIETDSLALTTLPFTVLQITRTIIPACEDWLSRQSKKRLTIAYFQVQILLQIARQTYSLHNKQSWNSAGELIRFALSAGFHCDPAHMGNKVSPFNQEMKRRLWATILELELQASIDRGMQSCMLAFRWDTTAPGNIDDASLDPQSERIAEAKPSESFTASSFLSLSQRTFRLRMDLNSVLNDPLCDLSHEQLLDYEDQIMKAMDIFPDWEKSERIEERTVKLVLELQFRQFLLLIHSRFLWSPVAGSRKRYSTMICLESATFMLKSYQDLRQSGYASHILPNSGIIRATLAMASAVHTTTAISKTFLSDPTSQAMDLLETAMTVLEDLVLRMRHSFKDYWLVSAALGLLQSSRDVPESIKKAQKDASWERLKSLYLRSLGLRGDESDMPAALKTKTTGDENVLHQSNVGEAAVSNALMDTAPALNSMQNMTDELLLTFDQSSVSDGNVSLNDFSQWALGDIWDMETDWPILDDFQGNQLTQ